MQLKYLVLGSVLGLVLVSQARAQDRWAGLYGGLSIDTVEAGAQIANSTVHDYEDDHTTLGVFGGYNFVRENGFVWGPEVSLHAVSSEGTRTDTAFGATGFEGSFILATKLRAGYASDKLFVYGALGLEMSDIWVRDIASTDTELSLGVSLGLGVEYAINDSWSTRLELSGIKHDGLDGSFNGTTQSVSTRSHRITLGVARKF